MKHIGAFAYIHFVFFVQKKFWTFWLDFNRRGGEGDEKTVHKRVQLVWLWCVDDDTNLT